MKRPAGGMAGREVLRRADDARGSGSRVSLRYEQALPCDAW